MTYCQESKPFLVLGTPYPGITGRLGCGVPWSDALTGPTVGSSVRCTPRPRRFMRTIGCMSEQPVEASGHDSGEAPSTAAAPASKRVRRTMLSTGFSGVPGKKCEACGFEGFRWQTECPNGHPLT
jgi:hypothetical protein